MMKKVEEPSGNYLFEETQRFPGWFRLLVGVLMASSLLVTVVVVIATNPDDKSEVWVPLAIVGPMQFAGFYFISATRLQKTVTSNGFYYRWLPYQPAFRYIAKEDLVAAEIRKSPSMKYGKTRMPGYGRVHNLSDKKGLQLDLGNGALIFFGTEDIEDFSKAVASLIKVSPDNFVIQHREF